MKNLLLSIAMLIIGIILIWYVLTTPGNQPVASLLGGYLSAIGAAKCYSPSLRFLG